MQLWYVPLSFDPYSLGVKDESLISGEVESVRHDGRFHQFSLRGDKGKGGMNVIDMIRYGAGSFTFCVKCQDTNIITYMYYVCFVDFKKAINMVNCFHTN